MKVPLRQLRFFRRVTENPILQMIPQKYYVCCGVKLTAKNKEEIYSMFSDYMEKETQIFTSQRYGSMINYS